MVTGFVDTAILVDILRGYQPSVLWINSQSSLGITPYVQMELINGVLDKVGLQAALKLIGQFDMIHPTQADVEWAMRQQITYSLSHNVGILDCLIASVAHRLGIPLFTRNLKHFGPLLGSLAQKPY